MYTFKSMIYNLLEDQTNNQEDPQSVITFYKAYAIALAIQDLTQNTDSTENIDAKNRAIQQYLKNPDTKNKTAMLNMISKDRKIIEQALQQIKETEKDYTYQDETTDLTYIKGCIGTIIEGY